jgi:hypothetical protein
MASSSPLFHALEEAARDDGRETICPWFDKLTMRAKPLKTRDLILSLSKDEAKISCPIVNALI